MSESFSDLITDALSERLNAHLLRSRRTLKHLDATHVLLDGKRLTNFASNNYLGLTHHPKMLAPMTCAAGAGAAGLISGYTHHHQRAEDAIAQWKQTEAALLMPSGYQANLAAIQTLHAVAESRGKAIRFILDKLAHASLIDAIRQTGATMRVFAHNDLTKLERLLEKREPSGVDVVVTESIFSMDGDAADLRGICQLKSRHDFVLLVDEAHGSGVYGPAGSGLVSELGLRDVVDIGIVTLSKALGVSGGAVCASRQFIDAVLNFGRAYIYSTAVSPWVATGAMRAIEILRDEPDRQARLRRISTRVRRSLAESGIAIPPGDSPIIPILMSDESAALEAAHRLESTGLLILAVRPPTIPRGTSRLRVTLSCEHTDDEIAHLVNSIQNHEGRKVTASR
jgi:8-amino-7-oxononanoate synthase